MLNEALQRKPKLNVVLNSNFHYERITFRCVKGKEITQTFPTSRIQIFVLNFSVRLNQT